MLWLVAGASMAKSYIAGSKERKRIADNNVQIKLNNISVIKETAQEISGLLANQTVLRQQAADARNNATAAGMLGLSTAQAMRGAAGVQGASVDAIELDIDRQVEQAKESVESSVLVEQFNMSQQLRSLVASRKAQLGQTQRVPSSSEVFKGAAIGTALEVGALYANAYFNYGGSNGRASR